MSIKMYFIRTSTIFLILYFLNLIVLVGAILLKRTTVDYYSKYCSQTDTSPNFFL